MIGIIGEKFDLSAQECNSSSVLFYKREKSGVCTKDLIYCQVSEH